LNWGPHVDVLVALGLKGLALAAVRLGRRNADIVCRVLRLKHDEQHDGDRNHRRNADCDQVGPAVFFFLARPLRFLRKPPLLLLMKFLTHGERGYQQA